MALSQVVGDRLGAGVVALALELAAQPHDRLDDLGRRFVLAGARPPGARLERLVAAFAISLDQLIDPALREPVGPSDLPGAPPLQEHGVDHVAPHPHTGTRLSSRCPVCPDTSVHYVVAPHTPGPMGKAHHGGSWWLGRWTGSSARSSKT